MKTLVLQLARFGDIYQTWPALNALVRDGHEVHVLVRERFRDALVGGPNVKVHCLPTHSILEPLLDGDAVDKSLVLMNEYCDNLKALGFDQVINLSFSPFSSYLTDYLDIKYTRGYTRFSDGYLCIPDDASAYFFAQGQTGGFNRFHITEIFASISGVDLKPEDFIGVMGPSPRERRVIVHLGASQSARVYPAELWIEVLNALIPSSGLEWILVGSSEEVALAENVLTTVCQPGLHSRVGQTKLPELMNLIASSMLVIGSDSAPSQIASLTQTPVLHLTSNASNFWTTGPTSPGSRILYAESLEDIKPWQIVIQAEGMLRSLPVKGPCALRPSVLGSYELHDLAFDDFGWLLVKALYTEGSYPATERMDDLIAFQRLFELAELAQHSFEHIAEGKNINITANQLKSVDILISEIGKLSPRVNPLVQWFETERLRLPPADRSETLVASRKLYADLQTIASVYRRFEDAAFEQKKVSELCLKIVPQLREYDFHSVESEFQDLVSTLHELSRHSTKVSWPTLLGGLNDALSRRDFIEMADQLEYLLVPALS